MCASICVCARADFMCVCVGGCGMPDSVGMSGAEGGGVKGVDVERSVVS